MQAQTSPPASSFDAQHFPKLQPVSHHTKPHLHSTSATYTITVGRPGCRCYRRRKLSLTPNSASRWPLSLSSAPTRAWPPWSRAACSTPPALVCRRLSTTPRAPTPTCPSTPRPVSSPSATGSTASPASSPPSALRVRHFRSPPPSRPAGLKLTADTVWQTYKPAA